MKRYLPVFSFVLLFGACAIRQKPYAGGSGSFSKLVWQDEFNGSGLPDSARWTYEQGYVRNRELQFYTKARLQNARMENGNLVITARHDSLQTAKGIYPITSASLHTYQKQSWTYGRIEVRAKVPASLGTWPAIWMLGTNKNMVGWPACGEIDIMEHVEYMPDTVHFNVHTAKYNHVKGTGKGTRTFVKAPQDAFHVYAIEWFSGRIDWYFDDQRVFTFADEKTGKDAWPFNEPQYLILNLAFGGAWGGARGVDTASLPQHFFIDYVRVYQ
jgi:beta-glucanase (GH16 family)